MNIRVFERKQIRKVIPIYLANLFVSLHYAAVLFVNSSNLGKFYPKNIVSGLFILGALLNIILLALAPKIIRIIGNKNSIFIFIFLEILAVLGLATSHSPVGVALSFLIYSTVMMMIYYCLDLFLEDVTETSNTGEIRGIDLTISNTAIALAPLLVAFLTPDGDFTLLYFAAAFLLIPALFITFFMFKGFKDQYPLSKESKFDFKNWLKHKFIRRVTLARLVLEIFYAVMVIYTPIYLYNTIGFSWSQIGFIFAVMLLPFVMFELPVGELVDHWCTEKDIMTVGFFIMGMSLLTMPFIGKDIYSWMVILFISRIGASFVEVTSESYFFKRVWKTDTVLISIFRLTRPVAIILGSVIGVITLTFFPFRAIFLILAIVVFFGTQISAILKPVDN